MTLSASAAEGSKFNGWSGSGCTGTGTCKVTMSEAKEVTAEFESIETEKFLLEVIIEGPGSGEVKSSVARHHRMSPEMHRRSLQRYESNARS